MPGYVLSESVTCRMGNHRVPFRRSSGRRCCMRTLARWRPGHLIWLSLTGRLPVGAVLAHADRLRWCPVLLNGNKAGQCRHRTVHWRLCKRSFVSDQCTSGDLPFVNARPLSLLARETVPLHLRRHGTSVAQTPLIPGGRNSPKVQGVHCLAQQRHEPPLGTQSKRPCPSCPWHTACMFLSR